MRKITTAELRVKKFVDDYRKRIDKINSFIAAGELPDEQLLIMKRNKCAYMAMISDLESALFYEIKKDALVFPDGYFTLPNNELTLRKETK